jgi:adenylosuccinate synthase
MRDLLEPARLRDRLEVALLERNVMLSWLGAPTFEPAEVAAGLARAAARLAPHVADARTLVNAAWQQKQNILFEGAQGTMLDVGHGTYPFVTSSHTTSAGVGIGVGVPPQAIERVLGICKAYATRVGSGPFPTELHGTEGEVLRRAGHEFGATTGRPRRCGWFDVPAVRYAHMINGFTGLAVTKLDVLSGLGDVHICVEYELDGRRLQRADADAITLERVRPVYEVLPGWDEDLTGARSLADLPKSTRRFLERLSKLCEVPIDVVSVGPGRDQTLVLAEPF